MPGRLSGKLFVITGTRTEDDAGVTD